MMSLSWIIALSALTKMERLTKAICTNGYGGPVFSKLLWMWVLACQSYYDYKVYAVELQDS